MDDKKNPFAGQHTVLSLKISPNAAVGMKTFLLFFMIQPFIDSQLNISFKLSRLYPKRFSKYEMETVYRRLVYYKSNFYSISRNDFKNFLN